MPNKPAGLIASCCDAMLFFWHKYCSPFALPLFVERNSTSEESATKLARRDSMVALLAVLAAVTFFKHEKSSGLLHVVVVAFALWRLIDLGAMIFSHAVFGGLTNKGWLYSADQSALQRIAVLMVVNYCEIMLWFASLYYWIGESAIYGPINDPNLKEIVTQRHAAFFVSLSTMTTVGYGTFAPVGTYALLVATYQSLLVLLFVGKLVAVVISRLLNSSSAMDVANSLDGIQSPHAALAKKEIVLCWLSPFLCFFVILAIVWWLFL